MSNSIQRFINKWKWFIKNFRSISSQAMLVKEIKYLNYNSDGLMVFNNCDCLTEKKFADAYQRSLTVDDWRGKDGTKFDMRWRYYITCSMAAQVQHLEGDYVECGVYKGGYSLAIMNYIPFTDLNKKFWLMDTYEGLSADHLTEKEKAAGLHEQYGHYEDSYKSVQAVFRDYPAVIIKGTVPETLGQCKAEKVAYLSIDMNCVEPEIAAIRYFWDKLVKGAVVVLDDYGFRLHMEQKIAFDAFAREKNVSILQLPTGQGIIFKP